MVTPNYSFEKRQRDLEKKRKQEEKRLRKLSNKKDGKSDDASVEPESAVDDADDIPAADPGR